jgi:hypothetical protein
LPKRPKASGSHSCLWEPELLRSLWEPELLEDQRLSRKAWIAMVVWGRFLPMHVLVHYLPLIPHLISEALRSMRVLILTGLPS